MQAAPRGTQAKLAKYADIHPRTIMFWLQDDPRWMTRKTETKVWRFFREHGFEVPEDLGMEPQEQAVVEAAMVARSPTGQQHALSFPGLDVNATIAYILDLATTRVVYANEAAAQVVGFTREALCGMRTEDVLYRVHPEDREVWGRFYHVLVNQPLGISVNLEFRVQAEVDAQGQPVWRWLHACQTLNHLAGLGRVITGIAFDLRRAQLGASPLRKVEDRALTLPPLAPLARLRQTRKLQELLTHLALTPEQFGMRLGAPAGEITAWLEGHLALSERDKKVIEYEFAVPGDWWGQEGEAIAETIGRERQLQCLKEAATRSTAGLIYIFSLRTHRNEYINPAMERLLGMSAEQVRQLLPEQNTIIHPGDRDRFWEHIAELATRPLGTAEDCEYRVKVGAAEQGPPGWCWIHVNHTLGEAGGERIVTGWGLVLEKAQAA